MSGGLVPEVGVDDRPFWESGIDGVLRLQQCRACDRFQHPPSPRCQHCLSEDLWFAPVSGRGEIYSVSVNHQAWLPGLETPYAVVVVVPQEAPDLRLVSRIVGNLDPEDPPRIGDQVAVSFVPVDEVWLPFFEVLEEFR